MMKNLEILPAGVEIEILLNTLRKLSWGAADILLAYARGEQPPHGFPKALDIKNNSDGPVSAADLAVNKWLLDGLLNNYPDINWGLLSEESAKEQNSSGTPSENNWLWILDPLDGTKDFLQGTGEYAVHLALIKGNKAVIGVILLPEIEELWFGINGSGAWCENRDGEKSPVIFSERKIIKDSVLVASRSHRDQRLETLISKIDISLTKSVGSVGCKIATILRGESDIYISLSGKSSPKDWDMAAPEAVLTAAGGMFTHADGKPLKYNTGNLNQSGCLIASNGINHSSLCKRAKSIMESIDPNFCL